MKLIADCGSTKIHWCLLARDKVVREFFTTGINAVMLTGDEIYARLADELAPQLLADDDIRSIYFYGAGCISPEVCGNVAEALKRVIPSADEIDVNTDLLAAARALCGHEPGIACIMGTGSNSCYYDGTQIVQNVSPLGFILGDEGSGAVLGKLFMGDVLKNQLPADLTEKFLTEYGLDRLTVIHRVYKEPGANRFLASVVPFLSANIDQPQIHRLVVNAFGEFFKRNIAQYPDWQSRPVHFIGSVAYYFRPVLEQAATRVGCTVGTVIQSPMPGLIEYHKAN